ncbi:MAG: hypothetical protein AB7S38_17235 [Vulcanimicrobiota bacterium]
MQLNFMGGLAGALIGGLMCPGPGAIIGGLLGLFSNQLFGGLNQALGAPTPYQPNGFSGQALNCGCSCHNPYQGAWMGGNMANQMGGGCGNYPGSFGMPGSFGFGPSAYGYGFGPEMAPYMGLLQMSQQRNAAMMNMYMQMYMMQQQQQMMQMMAMQNMYRQPQVCNRQHLDSDHPGRLIAGRQDVGQQRIHVTPNQAEVRTMNEVRDARMTVTTRVNDGGFIETTAGETPGATISQTRATSNDLTAQTTTTVVNNNTNSRAIVEDTDGDINTRVTIRANGQVDSVNPGQTPGDDVTTTVRAGDADDGPLERFASWATGNGNGNRDINLENVRSHEVRTLENGQVVIVATMKDGSVRYFNQPGDSDDNWVERTAGWVDNAARATVDFVADTGRAVINTAADVGNAVVDGGRRVLSWLNPFD